MGISSGLPSFLDPLQYLTENQRLYYEKIKDPKNNIVMCHAVAGVGKSHISVYTGLELLYSKKSPIEQIIIIVPIVDVGREDALGFLPGEMLDKISEYVDHITNLLHKLVPQQVLASLFERHKIIYKPLNFLRGANLESAYIIMDEAQNASKKQLKTLLTRISDDSKLVIEGDLSQCDKYNSFSDSGFFDVWKRMKGVEGIEYIEFTVDDSVRSKIVKRILQKYSSEEFKVILNGIS